MPSTVAGYLLPVPPPAPQPLYDDPLDDVFHGAIKGVLGMADGSLIRPRWQKDPPNQPDFDVDWVAFGITVQKGDWNPWQGEILADEDTGLGVSVFERDEELLLMLSFYGPNARDRQSLYQDGLLVEQNRQELEAAGIKLIGFGEAYNVPALMKEQWVKKVDQRVTFKRRIRRYYPIRFLLGSGIGLDNEQYITQIIVPV